MSFCEINLSQEENKEVITLKILIVCKVSLTVTYIQKCIQLFISKNSVFGSVSFKVI